MFCKACEYPLWNSRSGACPECGHPFKASDHEFAPNSVRFLCPHCSQHYYGTSAKGHLVPFAFNCVSCGQAIDMDQMVLQPAEGLRDEQTRPERIPWLERKTTGFFSAWGGTFVRVISRPGRLMRSHPGEGGGGAATWFAVLTLGGYFTLTFVVLAIIVATTGGLGPPILGFVLGAGVMVGIAVAAMLLWGVLTHGILRLTGPVLHPTSRTIACVGYGSAASFLMAVPCVGFYLIPFAWLWWGIVVAIMLTATQRVSGLRASFAALLPPVLLLLVTVGGFFLAMTMALTTAGRAGAAFAAASAAATGPAPTANCAAAVTAYAVDNGVPPRHAIELLEDGSVTIGDLYIFGTPMGLMDETVGTVVIEELPVMTDEERAEAVATAVSKLPADMIAHRLGDMVFVYHGMDLNDPSLDPGLWVVICAQTMFTNSPPPPAARPSATPPSATRPVPPVQSGNDCVVTVGLADGTTVSMLRSELIRDLPAQNALREAAGLEPIPDPFTITQAKPVVGSGD